MQLIPLLAALATVASATKVQYYRDGGCSDYAVELSPPSDGTCWGYQYDGTHSAKITSCTSPRTGCYCEFFQEEGCRGGKWTATTGTTNCASNWNGGGFKRLKCYYF